jgi:hypothetical protein
MAQRRAKWAERGWDNYQEILPLPDTNGDAATHAKPTIPVRVYGEHAQENA